MLLIAEEQSDHDTPVIVAVYYASGFNKEYAFQNTAKGIEFFQRVFHLKLTTMPHIQHATIRRAMLSLN